MTREMLHVDPPLRKGYARRVTIALTIEEGPHAGVPRAEVFRRIKAIIRLLQLDKSDISFVLTDDKRIHQLNKLYRGKDKPTDVLAFAMHEGEFGGLAGAVLGDVIVSVPIARKQALSNRVPVLEEVTMLLAHGLLHLLGWDHETAAKDRRMRAETARLCAAATADAPAVARLARHSKGGGVKALTRKPSAVAPRKRREKDH
jgi:probable rRNA maturation factor